MNGGCGVCLYLPLVRPPYHLSITFALFPIFLALIIMFFVNCKRLGLSSVVVDVNPECLRLSSVVVDVNPEYLGLSSVVVDVNPECLGLSSVAVDVNPEYFGLSSVTSDVNSEYLAVSSVSAPFPTGKGRGWGSISAASHTPLLLCV